MIVSSFVLTGCTGSGNDTTTTTAKKSDPINESVTKTVTGYEVDMMTFDIGEKIEREITYKGVIRIGNTNATGYDYNETAAAYNDGLKAYINMVNFNGGIGGDYSKGEQGYFIEFINYDDANDGEDGLEYTKKLVEEDNVFAIVGQFSENTVDATLDYIKDNGVIFVGPASGNSEIFNFTGDADTAKNGSTIFPVRPMSVVEGKYIVECVNELYPDAKKIGIVFADDGEGTDLRNGVEFQCNDVHTEKYECVSVEAVNGNFDAEKLSACDVVIVAAGRTNAEKIFRNLVDEKTGKPVFACGNVLLSHSDEESEFYEAYRGLDEADKFPVYLTNWFSTYDVEGYVEYALDMTKTYGNIQRLDNKYAMEGWIVADVFCEGLRRIAQAGNNVTTENYVESMESEIVVIKMGKSHIDDVTFEVDIDYSYGYRLGSLYFGLTNLDFEQIVALEHIKDKYDKHICL